MVGIILGNGGGSGADVSNVDATAGDVLAPKIFVDSNGDEITGTVPTYTGTANLVPDGSDHPFSNIYIPANGLTVKAISLQSKTAYPSGAEQEVTADDGKYLNKAIVKAVKNKAINDIVPDSTTQLTLDFGVTINTLFGIFVFYSDTAHTSKSTLRMVAANRVAGTGVDVNFYLSSIYVKASTTASWDTDNNCYIYSMDKTNGIIVLKDSGSNNKFYDKYAARILYC